MHNFLSALLGPMFAKEMIEIARRKRYFINRVLYGLVLLFTMFLVWDSHRGRFGGAGTASIREMADFAEALFHAVSGVQYGAVFLFVPLFLCGVIASEREERTLDLLFTTRLADREIVLGKLGSRVAVIVVLLFFTLPVLSLVMLFGGVDPLSLWRMLASTLLAVLYAGAHTIYFSTITKSAIGALVRSYWWMAVWLIGLPMALMISAGGSLAAERFCLSVLVMVDPLFAFVMAMDGRAYNQVTALLGASFFPLAFVLPGGWSIFLLWRAVRRLRLAPKPFTLLFGKIPLIRTLRRDLAETEKIRAHGRQRRAGRLFYLFRVRNPLWLRSRLTRVYDREGYIGRVQWLSWGAAFFFIVLFLVFERRALTERGAATAFCAPSWLAVAALIAILSATSLVGDRRRGFLDLVLMTPLTPREIVDGTLLSVWQHIRRSYWLPCVLGLFFWMTGSCTWAGVWCSIITATLFGALLALHGTACSLTAKTLPGALVPTFLFPLLVNVGIVFLIPIFWDAAGLVLCLLSAVCLIITWFWVRRRTTAAIVGCHFMAVHLALACLATCWTITANPRAYPIAVINPAHMAIGPLSGDPATWLPELSARSMWWRPHAAYWLCLIVNFIWARRWLIRHFEQLVERTDKPAAPISRVRLHRRSGDPGCVRAGSSRDAHTTSLAAD